MISSDNFCWEFSCDNYLMVQFANSKCCANAGAATVGYSKRMFLKSINVRRQNLRFQIFEKYL